MSIYRDKVRCIWCEKVSIVERVADECPSCHRTGFLADVEQDIEVPGEVEVQWLYTVRHNDIVHEVNTLVEVADILGVPIVSIEDLIKGEYPSVVILQGYNTLY